MHDPLSQKEKSLAQSVADERMPSGRSLTTIENRIGLKILPWGIPFAGI